MPRADYRRTGLGRTDYRRIELGSALAHESPIASEWVEHGRMQVSSSDSGPSNFDFKLNPSYYDAVDKSDTSELKTLHGSQICQKSDKESPRVLRWSGFPIDNQHLSPIVDYFRSIKGETRYFKFNSMSNINNRWGIGNTWKKARILNLKIDYKPGGNFVYNNVDLLIKPEG
jgi:hypothetical protein